MLMGGRQWSMGVDVKSRQDKTRCKCRTVRLQECSAGREKEVVIWVWSRRANCSDERRMGRGNWAGLAGWQAGRLGWQVPGWKAPKDKVSRCGTFQCCLQLFSCLVGSVRPVTGDVYLGRA